MKKFIRNILTVILAVAAAAFTAAGLSACGGAKLEGLRVENAKTVFRIGDEFETGEDFKVYAVYSDGTETDVTAEVGIRQEAGFDMNVPADYQITVNWGGKKEVYTIYVNEFDNILRKIKLDASNVKKTYNLGDEAVFDGLKIICTYENAQGLLIESTTTSLADFSLEIKNGENHTVTDVFDKLGTYTVTVSMGSIKDSFKVDVSGVNIDTVQGAVAVGSAFKGNVLSGTFTLDRALQGSTKAIRDYNYQYEFGDNYTYIKENAQNPKNEYHLSMENSKIFSVQFQNGSMISNNNVQSAMMDGAPFGLWWNRATVYGIENTLSYLYNAAKECTNKDLRETADPVTRTYSFSFSGLVFYSNSSDYYETEVTFTLGEDYSVSHAEYVQRYFENSEANPEKTPSFIVENGVAKPNPARGEGYFSAKDSIVVNQTVGERTKTNPYSADMMRVKSYNLTYNGKVLGDNGVIDCGMDSPKLTIEISDIMPTTADFRVDSMYFDYDGNYGGEVDSAGLGVDCTGFMAFRTGNSIKITLRNGGVWVLKIRTARTSKTVTFNVTGIAPTSIAPQLLNTATGSFSSGNQKTLAIGGTVYFRGQVNAYANETQTAAITGGSASGAKVESATVNGVKCFKFSGLAAGTYTVTVSSAAATGVKCTFTFTVSEAPDYAEILKGKYQVTNHEGDIFTVEFAPASGGGEEVTGAVTVTRTPTKDDNTPEYDKQKTQTLNYSVDFENGVITLTAVSGENLGVELSVNEKGELMLEDHLGSKFKLNAVTE